MHNNMQITAKWSPFSEIDMTSYFHSRCSNLDEIRQSDAEFTPLTAKWSRSKPEVEFQYGGSLYFETESRYISAANGDIWTNFFFAYRL